MHSQSITFRQLVISCVTFLEKGGEIAAQKVSIVLKQTEMFLSHIYKFRNFLPL